jgi:hypothetical protein
MTQTDVLCSKKNNVLQQKNNLPKAPLAPKKTEILTPEEEAKRLKRQRRFEEDAAQFRAENVSTPMQMMHLVRELHKHTI